MMDVDKDLDDSNNLPLVSPSPPSDTATKLVKQLETLLENRKEWADKIGNAELDLLNCDECDEATLQTECDKPHADMGTLDKKSHCLKETLKMMKTVREAKVKNQDIPGKEDEESPPKKNKEKAELDSDTDSKESDYEDNKQLIIPKDAPRYESGDSAKDFLNVFESDMPSLLGPKKFDKLCKRYLIVLTKCMITKKALKAEFQNEGLDRPTWEQCEKIFLRVATTEDQRTFELSSIITAGQTDHETYQQFALRMLHDINLYGIKDENEMVVDIIRAGLNDEAKNNLAGMLRDKKKTKYSTITELLGDVKTLSGPSSVGIASVQRITPVTIHNKRINQQKNNPNKKHKNNGYYGGNQPVVYQNNNPNSGFQFQAQQASFQQPQPFQSFPPQYQNQQLFGSNNHNNNNNSNYGLNNINRSKAGKRNRGSFYCDNCGQNSTHSTKQCKICNKCGKKGHVAEECQGTNYHRNGGQVVPTLMPHRLRTRSTLKKTAQTEKTFQKRKSHMKK
ncbi:MAG: hypothetical protein BYD32DRAFT_435432 [Podila humilis]|nr:MAG: hypothetical protein BYD32DRAFT_435432 [Podila humilis]